MQNKRFGLIRFLLDRADGRIELAGPKKTRELLREYGVSEEDVLLILSGDRAAIERHVAELATEAYRSAIKPTLGILTPWPPLGGKPPVREYSPASTRVGVKTAFKFVLVEHPKDFVGNTTCIFVGPGTEVALEKPDFVEVGGVHMMTGEAEFAVAGDYRIEFYKKSQLEPVHRIEDFKVTA